jgi:putative transcriptional regulator
MSAMFDDLMTGLDEVEAFLSGEKAGYKVNLPADIDVKTIRQQLNMTQARFSEVFGFSLDAVKHWEGGRRTPEAAARAFLIVIARDPRAVLSALHPVTASSARKRLRSTNGRTKASNEGKKRQVQGPSLAGRRGASFGRAAAATR